MLLPFIELDAVWHMGDPAIIGPRPSERPFTKNWDYEFGLFSVSLDPEAWREGWAGEQGETYELRARDRLLRFVDADLVLSQRRGALEAAALAQGFLSGPPSDHLPTAALYAFLNVTPGSQLQLAGRSFEDQALQAALGGLGDADQSIDGLWWSDTLCDAMRTERGGIYQHRLDDMIVTRGGVAPPPVRPVVTWEESGILG